MTCFRRLLPLLLLLLLALLTPLTTRAHESCCKNKLLLGNKDEEEFIKDPDDIPPLIESGCDFEPDDWDEATQGTWQPAMVEDPDYTRRLIPNPNYRKPATVWDKLVTEVWAALPWVTLGVLITGALSCLPLEQTVWQHLTSQSDRTSVVSLVVSACLGLATPLCSCGALPLCVGLASRGVPLASVVAFLTASQSAGLDSAAVTYGLLGLKALLARLVGATILALAVGVACSSAKTNKEATLETTKSVPTCHATHSMYLSSILLIFVSSCLETSAEIYPTVLAGLSLSTAALHYLPSLSTYDTSDSLSQLLILAAAVPLQLCEHTSVTLAAAIQKAGGSPGLAFALLLSAPATNLPTLLFVHHQSGSFGVVVTMTALFLVAALGMAHIVDMLHLDLLVVAESDVGGKMADLPDGWIAASPYLAGSMVVLGYGQKVWKKIRGYTSTTTVDDCCGSTKAKKE